MPKRTPRIARGIAALMLFGAAVCAFPQPAEGLSVGAARVEITPTEPIRLTGYAVRQTPATRAEQPLWAKALALRGARGEISVLVTVDHCGVPGAMTDEVAERLRKAHGIPRERFVVCSTHTHSGPLVNGFAPNIFAQDIPPNDQSAIDRYSARLTDEIEKAARQAISNLKPGSLGWGQGQAGFAANRRTAGGPVDHSVNVLQARDAQGKSVAILANYACHCTTLGGEFNAHAGDWAGYAQEQIEASNPGAVALVAIGCGADANPNPRGGPDFGLAHAKAHGRALAEETSRVLASGLTKLSAAPTGIYRSIQLPYQKHFTQEQWESRAQRPGIVGYHARKYLARLRAGAQLPLYLDYPIQTWTFGQDLAMVFLGGEVVVDYAIGLKDLFDSRRLWINAYANDVPCYIPSRRILAEGGYEAEDSLWYYDRPARLAPSTESLILHTVQSILPSAFANQTPTNSIPAPRSVAEALSSFTLDPKLGIECVAAEPLVVDPVAIDFGADGRLWVLEMRDYPSGLDGQGLPGGRVRVLRDPDGNGQFDESTTFLDNLPYPTGIMVWRDGVIIGAAPDVLFARDLDGDGKADRVEKWFTGFATHNFQARVNGFSLGLDGWIHGSAGLFGGTITNGLDPTRAPIECRNRDFLWNPSTGEFKTGAGVSQQGRVRDDFGRWFGNDNSTLLWHYPFPETVLRRNPHTPAPRDRISIASSPSLQQLQPTSRTLARFNDFHHANRVTSACGPGLYRDLVLGDEYYGNAFVCEPVHNLVRRLILEPSGSTFLAHKSTSETNREFLSSTDHWFRPAQVRTGPDGGLWVVDMYRQVIEHPRWITPERLARIDVRAGEDRGRIYRIRPKSRPLRQVPKLEKLNSAALARLLDTPNGTVRDLVQQRIETGLSPVSALPVLRQLARNSKVPAARAQALAMLNNHQSLQDNQLRSGLLDRDAGVRSVAVRIAGNRIQNASLRNAFPLNEVSRLLKDPNPSVQFEAALALGDSLSPDVPRWIAQCLESSTAPSGILAAIPTARPEISPSLIRSLLPIASTNLACQDLIEALIPSAVVVENAAGHGKLLRAIAPEATRSWAAWQLNSLARLLESRVRLNMPATKELEFDWDGTFDLAARLALNSGAALAQRLASLRVWAFDLALASQPVRLRPLLTQNQPAEIQSAVIGVLGKLDHPDGAAVLLDSMANLTPAYRHQVIEQIVSRTTSIRELLRRLESRTLAPLDIGAAHRDRLLRHLDPDIQTRARSALELNPISSKRDLISRYAQALPRSPANAAGGAELFMLHCAPCHRYRNTGVAVGPDLESLTDRSRDGLLTAILHPNAAIDDRYRAYEIETRDGRMISGVMSSESSTGLTLVQSGGTAITLLRSEIGRVHTSGMSLMPEGFENLLTPESMASLVLYLQSSPVSAGELKSRFVAAGSSPVRLLLRAEQLPYRSWMGTFPLALCRLKPGQEQLAWTAAPIAAPGESGYRRFRFAAAMGFLSEPPGFFTLKLNGHAIATFEVTVNSAAWNTPDGRIKVRFAVQESTDQDGFGILTVDAAPELLESTGEARFEVTAQPIESQRWFGIYLVE